MAEIVGFVGVCGGAGTTRVCVETAATLARAGADVAVVDAAFGTQGLSRYVEGRIEPDLTKALLDERPIDDALYDCWGHLDGRVSIAPAHAPFERLARAKTPEAARRLEAELRRLAATVDHVVVDVPPLAANQAVGAATAVDDRVLVAPASRRGVDLLPRMRGRLVDVGETIDGVLVTRAAGTDPADTPLPDADHALPSGPADPIPPTATDPDAEFAPAVAAVTEAVFDRSLDLSFEEAGLLG